MRLPITVWGLALGQALLVSGNILLVSVTALIGQQIAPSLSLITLPVALQFLGLMGVTLPAAHLMRIFGRKAGFLIGNLIGVGGAVLAYSALAAGNFTLFCVSTFLLGMAIGVGQQYRFAAIEGCSGSQHPRAISLVMAGGIIAAILGPNLAIWGENLLPDTQYLGAFAVLIGLYVLTTILISCLPLARPSFDELHGEARSYSELFRQPQLIAAITAGVIGYAVMVLIMTATPLAMQGCGFGFSSTASVIQWHVLGMFAPSFITGRLITRFSEAKVIQTGCLLLILCVLLNQLGTSYWHFWTALVALGVGWNFTFIGATSLLTHTYRPAEKAKVQGINDFLVFGSAAIGSLLAGYWQSLLGWEILNLLMLPAIGVAMLLVALSAKRHQQKGSVPFSGKGTDPFNFLGRLMETSSRSGIVFALSAFFLWAVAPIYFKEMSFVPATEILAHRVIWSCVIVFVLIILLRYTGALKKSAAITQNAHGHVGFDSAYRLKLGNLYLGHSEQ
ncbi:MFS transporter [Nitrincola sp. A-D6]|uniref:MFS transporter n=1 Tax=Nitrincola sp. A-D6 TaxID=1545442 RepID=UPI0009DEEE03|nr:MFS transporter [Nitrincola sp. A-D6]